MIFGTKNLYTSNEILDALLKGGEIKNSTGAVSIVRKDGRKTVATGKIYFRNELIYAVEVSNKPVPIGLRVRTGGLVDTDDLNRIIHRNGGDTSPRIVNDLLVGQLITEKNLNGYVKEHFIEGLGEILSWDSAIGEWHPNTKTDNFVMPYVALEKIRMILNNRASFRKEFAVAVRTFFRESEIDSLTFSTNLRSFPDFAPEVKAILECADGKSTVADIAAKTGITEFTVFQTIISFWKKGTVSIRLGGIDLPFASVQEAARAAKEQPLEKEWVPKEVVVPISPVEEIPEPESESADETPVEPTRILSNNDESSEEFELGDESDTESSENPDEDETEFITGANAVIKEADDGTDDYLTVDDEQDEELTEEDDEYLDEGNNEHESVAVAENESDNAGVELSDETSDVTWDEEEQDELSEADSLENISEIPALRELAETYHHHEEETLSETTSTFKPKTANLKLAEFTAELNRLQSEIAEHESVLEKSAAEVDAKESKLKEAQAVLDAAQRDYDESVAEKNQAETSYEEACGNVDALVQSFKFSG